MEELRFDLPERPLRTPTAPLTLERVAPAADRRLLAAEIARLRPEQCLVRSGALAAYAASAEEIPHLLYEIGRLREIAFRAVGEGTGRAIDLDWFDSHYTHLVLWSHERGEMIGGYRLGRTDEILPRFGVDGLYTATTFEYRTELLARLTPGLELGRSFVRLEHQKSYSPLLLLWRAIAGFVVRHPQYRLLFGAVSISNEYTPTAQQLLVRVLRERYGAAALGRFVRPRTPVTVEGEGLRLAREALAAGEDLDAVDRRIARLEAGRCGVPVLVKQYVRLGGRFLEFSRDPDFRDSIDALVLVDLLASPARVLARFFGAAELSAFLADHRRLVAARELVA